MLRYSRARASLLCAELVAATKIRPLRDMAIQVWQLGPLCCLPAAPWALCVPGGQMGNKSSTGPKTMRFLLDCLIPQRALINSEISR